MGWGSVTSEIDAETAVHLYVALVYRVIENELERHPSSCQYFISRHLICSGEQITPLSGNPLLLLIS